MEPTVTVSKSAFKLKLIGFKLPEDPTKVRTTMERPSIHHNCSETILIPSTLVNMLVKTELTINAPNAMVSPLLSVKQQQAMRLVTMLKMLALLRSVVKWKVRYIFF